MFRVGPTPPPIDPGHIALLSSVEPATIGHAIDDGFGHGLRQIVPGLSMVGTAFTVRLVGMDATALHCAVDELRPGHVLVVDMGGDLTRACVGAMLSLGARVRGAAGIVVDGMVTDYDDLVGNGIAVFARGLSARTTRAINVGGDINVPVTIGGAIVHPGDVVMADANGVLFIGLDAALEAGRHAVEVQDAEAVYREQVLLGTSLAEPSGAAAFLAANRVDVSGH